MEREEILSPGKKIRKIRKDFKINQQDITGGEITRNLISIVENGKANLTPKVAFILSENINRVCKEKNIDFQVSTDYLLEDIGTQANKIMDKYIEALKAPDISLEKLNHLSRDIESFILEYPMTNNKAAVYSLIGDLYLHLNETFKAYKFFLKSYEHLIMDKNILGIIVVLLNLSYCSLLQNNYDETLYFNDLAYVYVNEMDEDTLYKFYINSINAFIATNKVDDALNIIKIVETKLSVFLSWNKEAYWKILSLKSSALKSKKYFNDTLKIQKKLFSSYPKEKPELKLQSICEFIDVYIAIKDIKNVSMLLNNNEDLINSYCQEDFSKNSNKIFYSLALAYEFISSNDNAKNFFLLAIDSSKAFDSTNFLSQILSSYFDFMEINNLDEDINDFKNELLTLIAINKVSRSSNLILKLINHYTNTEESEYINHILSFILD